MKELPLGIQYFTKIRDNNRYYIDKTAYIKPIVSSASDVILITRPRRFGKTLFLHTIKTFLQLDFQSPGNAAVNHRYFDGLAVTEDTEFCAKYMGQYPVIFLTFKDIDAPDYSAAYNLFIQLLEVTADEYSFLRNSPNLSPLDKELFGRYLDTAYIENPAHIADAKSFLQRLVTWLSKHFDRQVVLLIDEYDVPLAKAASCGYFDEMLVLMRSFLGQAPLLSKINFSMGNFMGIDF